MGKPVEVLEALELKIVAKRRVLAETLLEGNSLDHNSLLEFIEKQNLLGAVTEALSDEIAREKLEQ